MICKSSHLVPAMNQLESMAPNVRPISKERERCQLFQAFRNSICSPKKNLRNGLKYPVTHSDDILFLSNYVFHFVLLLDTIAKFSVEVSVDFPEILRSCYYITTVANYY